MGNDDPESTSQRLQLVSLHLNSSARALSRWVIQTVDLNCLRYLHTVVSPQTMAFVQQLIDVAVCVDSYHIHFESFFSLDKNLNLEKMRRLRTLEISVILEWEEEEIQETGDQGNPFNDAMRSLNTAPQTVEHLILNLEISNPHDLTHFMDQESVSLHHLGENRPTLRDVVVLIISENFTSHWLRQRGIPYVEAVFHGLHRRGILTVVAIPPPSRQD
ncbi:hypothetical protein C8R47DRAFT_1131257, partial [Mycena vitilis]